MSRKCNDFVSSSPRPRDTQGSDRASSSTASRPPSERDGVLLRPPSAARFPSKSTAGSRFQTPIPAPGAAPSCCKAACAGGALSDQGSDEMDRSGAPGRGIEPDDDSSEDATIVDDATAVDSDEGHEQDFPLFGDHSWHFAYDRRLMDFTNAVSSLVFAPEGRWLVAASGTTDPKVWEARSWAAGYTLKNPKKEQVRGLCISADECWLASVQPSAVNVYASKQSWKQVYCLPPENSVGSEWCCAAFCPATSSRLAALSTTQICIIDFAAGWRDDCPQRSHSLLRYSRPSCIIYTPCGSSVVCGLEDGKVLVWSSNSLFLERQLTAHCLSLYHIASSPDKAEYATRFVSCGMDGALCVWNTSTWIREQRIQDDRCGPIGVLSCSFSPTGSWLVSASEQLCIWRVCCTSGGRVSLCLHQRVTTIGGYEGMYSAVFCNGTDAIVAGSRDGALGVWMRVAGLPSRPPTPPQSVIRKCGRKDKQESDLAMPRPMTTVSPMRDASAIVRQMPPPPGTWSHSTSMRPADVPIRDLMTSDIPSRTVSKERVQQRQQQVVGASRQPQPGPNTTERRNGYTALADGRSGYSASEHSMPQIQPHASKQRLDGNASTEILRGTTEVGKCRPRFAIDRMGSSGSIDTSQLHVHVGVTRSIMVKSGVTPLVLGDQKANDVGATRKRWDANRFSSVEATLNEIANTRVGGTNQRFQTSFAPRAATPGTDSCPTTDEDHAGLAPVANSSGKKSSTSKLPQNAPARGRASFHRPRSCATLREQGSRVLCA